MVEIPCERKDEPLVESFLIEVKSLFKLWLNRRDQGRSGQNDACKGFVGWSICMRWYERQVFDFLLSDIGSRIESLQGGCRDGVWPWLCVEGMSTFYTDSWSGSSWERNIYQYDYTTEIANEATYLSVKQQLCSLYSLPSYLPILRIAQSDSQTRSITSWHSSPAFQKTFHPRPCLPNAPSNSREPPTIPQTA